MKHTLSLLALAALVMTGTALANHEAAAEEQSLRAGRFCEAVVSYAAEVVRGRDMGMTKAMARKKMARDVADSPDMKGITAEGKRYLDGVIDAAYKKLRLTELDMVVLFKRDCPEKFIPLE